MQGSDADSQAELESLRQERALLIDKLNNHPDVRKYAGMVFYFQTLSRGPSYVAVLGPTVFECQFLAL